MKQTVKLRRKLAVALTAGICFQSVQCGIDPNTLAAQWVGSIATLFISDYVNNLFNVNPVSF